MTLTDTPIGKDCVLAYDQPANWDTPSWEAIENAVDVSQPNIKKGTVDVPSRGSQGWKFKAPTMKEMDLQFGYLCQRGQDAQLEALRDSFLNDTPLMFAVLDGPIAGDADFDVQGFRFIGIVTEFPIDEPLEDARRIDIKVEAVRFKADGDLLLPEWYTIAAV